ncbi:MAG: hypothetical protein ABFR95_06295 [Actinomycetota bacterium]
MKRLAILAIAATLFASTAAIAFADDTDVEADSSETQELNDTQLLKAQLLADYLVGDDAEEGAAETAVEELVLLRTEEPVVGWGAMFKLLQLAKAYDIPLADLLAEYDEDDGWGFGKKFKDLGDEENDRLEGTAKNLGQLKKQQREPKTNNGNKP